MNHEKLNIVLIIGLCIVFIIGLIIVKADFNNKLGSVEQSLDIKTKLLSNDVINIGKNWAETNSQTKTNTKAMLDLFMVSMDKKSLKNYKENYDDCYKGELIDVYIDRSWYNETVADFAKYLIIEWDNGFQIIVRETGDIRCFRDYESEEIDCDELCLIKPPKEPIIGGRNITLLSR